MTLDPSRKLQIEAEAAKKLLAHLRDEGHGDDDELLANAVEGETSLHESIAAVIDRIDEKEVTTLGLEAKIAAFQGRLATVKKSIEFDRAAVEQAMIATEQSKIMLPSATVYVSKRKPGLIIENEADIPSEFFIPQEVPAPKLDKRALAAALTEGRQIPGATLDNGSVSLSVRRN